VDGSPTLGERAVNSLSDFTAEGLTQGVRHVRGKHRKIQPLVRLHGG
jgi:hypothetical protein